MTVAAQLPRNQYLGNGAQTVFSYTFEIVEAGDIAVYIGTVRQTLATHYTVSGAGNDAGGSVTFLSAPSNGAIVTFRRDMPYARQTDYQQGGAAYASDFNNDSDRNTLAIQQIQEQVERTLRLGPGSQYQAEKLEVGESSADRIDKVLGFDSNGDITLLGKDTNPTDLVTKAYADQVSGTDQAAIATAQAAIATAQAALATDQRELAEQAVQDATDQKDLAAGHAADALASELAAADSATASDSFRDSAEIAAANAYDSLVAALAAAQAALAAAQAAQAAVGEVVIETGGLVFTTPLAIAGVGLCSLVLVDKNDRPILAMSDTGLWALRPSGILGLLGSGGTTTSTTDTITTAALPLPDGSVAAVYWVDADDKPFMAVGSTGLWTLVDGVLTKSGVASVETYTGGGAYSSIYGTSDRQPWAYGDSNVIIMVPVVGQSLAMGSNPDAGTPIDTARTTTATYPDNVLKFGITGQSYGRVIPNGANVDRFVACTEVDIVGDDGAGGGYTKETICTAFGNTLYERFSAKVGATPQILMAVAAHGGTPYRGLHRGSPNYAELLRLATRAVQIAAADGKRIIIPGVIIQHGEANNGDAAEEYARNLTQWRANIDADLRAITRQYEPVRALIPQCNRRSASSRATASTPLSPLLADKMDPLVVCAGPIYDVDADSTATHPYSWGYLKMGTRYAYAAFDEWFDVGYRPLFAIEAYAQTNTTYRIKYNRAITVDDSGTIIDTALDISANRGFIFQDGTLSPPSVTNVTAISADTIELTLSGVPSGYYPRFHYATYSTVASMGRITGPRGCIRATASWGTARDDRAGGGTVPVYDWACTQTIFSGLGVVQ